jgi:hypothetical protein
MLPLVTRTLDLGLNLNKLAHRRQGASARSCVYPAGVCTNLVWSGLVAPSTFPPLCGASTVAFLPGAVAMHQGSHTEAMHDDRNHHHRQGERGQPVSQVGVQPVMEGVGQVVERTDTSYPKPADQTPL